MHGAPPVLGQTLERACETQPGEFCSDPSPKAAPLLPRAGPVFCLGPDLGCWRARAPIGDRGMGFAISPANFRAPQTCAAPSTDLAGQRHWPFLALRSAMPSISKRASVILTKSAPPGSAEDALLRAVSRGLEAFGLLSSSGTRTIDESWKAVACLHLDSDK